MVFRTLQKSAFHWCGFVLNISLLAVYLGFFVFSMLLCFLPWQAFCDAGEDGLEQVFVLMNTIVAEGTALANELLDVGTISATLDLTGPSFRCTYLGDEQHEKGNKLLLLGLFFCVLGQYHIFGIISHKYKLGANLHYKGKKRGLRGASTVGMNGEEGGGEDSSPDEEAEEREEDEDTFREVGDSVVETGDPTLNPMMGGETTDNSKKEDSKGAHMHTSKEVALVNQRQKNMDRQSTIRQSEFASPRERLESFKSDSSASERVSTAKSHVILASYTSTKSGLRDESIVAKAEPSKKKWWR
jgi:hypothetical protein